MGLLTDFIIADEDEAEALSVAVAPLKKWQGFDAKGLDEVKLAKLYALLTSVPYQKGLLREFELRASGSDNGPWVTRLPPALVQALASLTDVESTGSAWAEIEEFDRDGWEKEAVARALGRLCDAARQAEASHKRIFLRLSL